MTIYELRDLLEHSDISDLPLHAQHIRASVRKRKRRRLLCII